MRNFLFSFIAFAIFIPGAVSAQQYLVNLPIGETATFNDYINAVYLMFISIAALIAVVKIIIAGVKYMFSDIVTQKSDAKRDIQGALLGLVVVMAAVLILTVINPELTRFNPQINQITEQTRPELPTNPSGQSIAGSDQVLQNGDGLNWIGFGRRISSREDCVESYGTVIPGSATVADRCLISNELRTQALPTIASNNCPEGRTCTAELCDPNEIGFFENCSPQGCTADNGIYYDEAAQACVFDNDPQEIDSFTESTQNL